MFPEGIQVIALAFGRNPIQYGESHLAKADVSVSIVARDTQESASHRVAGLDVAKGLRSVKFVDEVFEDSLVSKQMSRTKWIFTDD